MNLEHLEKYAEEVKGKTMLQLLEARADWSPNTAAWQIVDREIRRRDERGTNFRSWLAVFISIAAVIVAWVTKHGVSGS